MTLDGKSNDNKSAPHKNEAKSPVDLKDVQYNDSGASMSNVEKKVDEVDENSSDLLHDSEIPSKG
jgi:hypothetical protein